MDSRAALYHITPENLALRREFIGLDGEVIELISKLQPWADEVVDEVAADLTSHHFEFSATADFLRAYVAEAGIELDALRAAWHRAQAGHWRTIFAEPSRPEPFGIEYFAGLLAVGLVAIHRGGRRPRHRQVRPQPVRRRRRRARGVVGRARIDPHTSKGTTDGLAEGSLGRA